MIMFILIRFIGMVVVSWSVTYLLTPHMISIARTLRIVDTPDNHLKQHINPTPYLGGVAVYAGFITALALLFPVANELFFVIVGATLLLFVGLIDDLLVLSPQRKFFGHMIAAFCFLRGGFYLKGFFLLSCYPNIVAYGWIILSWLWIVTIINAFNLIDVMDGLATTIALAIATALLCIACMTGAYHVVLLMGALIGALIAFLAFNKPLAQIYLGDSGSLFIGGLLSVAPFMVPWGLFHPYAFLAPLGLFFIPLMEVGMLIIVRYLKGIPFYRGSPDHFSLYLKRRGWKIFEILLFSISTTMILLLATIFFIRGWFSVVQSLVVLFLLGITWVFLIFKEEIFPYFIKTVIK